MNENTHANQEELEALKASEDIVATIGTAKTNTGKKLPAPLVIFALIVLFAAGFYWWSTRQLEQNAVHQENAYGISGEITAIGGATLTVVTPSLPVEGFVFSPFEKWIWQVTIGQASVTRQTTLDLEQSELKLISPTKNDLRVGMSVTITSAKDFSDQFMVPDKKIQASEIKIYE